MAAMAKRKKPKPICIYCQKAAGTTKDHVFPNSWYPVTTPTTVQRRTVPCCPPCNGRLKDAEDGVALDLLFVCNADVPEIAGVQDNIFKAWKIQHARDPEDHKHRAGKNLKILKTMAWPDAVPGSPVVFVRQGGGLYRPASPARKIDKDAMRAVLQKIVRGLHFLEVNWFRSRPGPRPTEAHLDPLLPLDLKFQYSLVPNPLVKMLDPTLTIESFSPELLSVIGNCDRYTMFGPGLHFRRFRTLHGGSMWLFRIWGQLDFVVFAYPPELAAQVEREAGLRV